MKLKYNKKHDDDLKKMYDHNGRFVQGWQYKSHFHNNTLGDTWTTTNGFTYIFNQAEWEAIAFAGR